MRLFSTLVMFCLMCLCAPLAVAEERKALPKPECTLKNKVFCGEWQDSQAFHLTITGNHIFYHDADPAQYDCQTIYESTDNHDLFSALKCQFFDDDSKRKTIVYNVFYVTEGTRERDKVVPESLHVSHHWALFLSELCTLNDGKLVCNPDKGSRGLISHNLK